MSGLKALLGAAALSLAGCASSPSTIDIYRSFERDVDFDSLIKDVENLRKESEDVPSSFNSDVRIGKPHDFLSFELFPSLDFPNYCPERPLEPDFFDRNRNNSVTWTYILAKF